MFERKITESGFLNSSLQCVAILEWREDGKGVSRSREDAERRRRGREERRGCSPVKIGPSPIGAYLNWLTRKQLSEVSVRTVQQALKNRIAFQNVADIKAGMKILETNGWLFPLPDEKTSGRPKGRSYLVHPAINPQ